MVQSTDFWKRITQAFGTDKVQEIADLIGLKYQSVRKWKLGEMPSLDTLVQIRNCTNSSIDWLVTGEALNSRIDSSITVFLEPTIKEKLVNLSTEEGETVEDEAAKLIIESLIARGIVTDKVDATHLLFFGDIDIKLVPIPLLGNIAAGRPIEVFDTEDTVLVAEEFVILGRKTYALRVQGDSMSDDSRILDGDLIIVVETQEAHPGQTVVALIDGDQATVKKYYRQNRQVVLRPANPRYKDIVLSPERVRIQGIVIGIQRRT